MAKSNDIKSWLNKLLAYRRKHSWVDIALLTLLCITIVICNDIWVRAELRPPHWDMARHLFNSLNYFHFAKDGLIRALFTSYSYYPPLLYWVSIPFYFIFGLGARTAVFSNTVFIFILVFSTYGIGKRLWNRQTGLLAAILVISLPIFVTQFKEFQLDAPATAMTALSLYVLIRTEEFKNRGWGLLFGLVLGLALLTKWTLLFVLILPIGYAVCVAVWSDYKRRKFERTFIVLLAGLLAYALASIWYVPNNLDIQMDLLNNAGAAGVREGDPPVGSLQSNIWYLKNLVNNQLYLIPTILFGIGTGFSIAKIKPYFTKNTYPWLLVIGTLVFFTFTRNKDARYTLPMLVGVAVIAVFWISQIKKPRRMIVSALVVLYALASFWLISFGSLLIPASLQAGPITVFAQHGYIIGAPTNENWQQQQIMQYISEQPGKKVLLDTTSPDTMWFNHWGNKYFESLYGVIGTGDVQNANYAIIPVGTELEGFTVIKTYTLPDGRTINLVQRQQ